jgi:threonine/homoserine/homoserine lactone efflux protein
LDDYRSTLLTIAAADWLSLIMPGPNFVLVTTEAIRRSRLHGLAAGLGIVAGNLAWCLVVIFGLEAAFRHDPWLSPTLRMAGAAYLFYLGFRLWRGAGRPRSPADVDAGPSRLGGAFGYGVLISITNPTAVAYYAGVFSALLKPSDPTWLLVTAVGLICFNSVVWNTLLSFVFSTARAQELYERWDEPITYVAALFMLGFGIKVALSAS